MTQEELTRMINEQEGRVSLAFPALMRKVYVWMTLALVITGITAYIVSHNESIIMTMMTTPALMWGLIIAELALSIPEPLWLRCSSSRLVHLPLWPL